MNDGIFVPGMIYADTSFPTSKYRCFYRIESRTTRYVTASLLNKYGEPVETFRRMIFPIWGTESFYPCGKDAHGVNQHVYARTPVQLPNPV